MDDYEWRFRIPAPSFREVFDEMDPARRRRRRRRGWAFATALVLVGCSAAAWQTVASIAPTATAGGGRAVVLTRASSVMETLSDLLDHEC